MGDSHPILSSLHLSFAFSGVPLREEGESAADRKFAPEARATLPQISARIVAAGRGGCQRVAGGGDGIMDLKMKFKTAPIERALRLGEMPESELHAILLRVGDWRVGET